MKDCDAVMSSDAVLGLGWACDRAFPYNERRIDCITRFDCERAQEMSVKL